MLTFYNLYNQTANTYFQSLQKNIKVIITLSYFVFLTLNLEPEFIFVVSRVTSVVHISLHCNSGYPQLLSRSQ